MNIFQKLSELQSTDLSLLGFGNKLPDLSNLKISNVHEDNPSPDAVITSDVRYCIASRYPQGYTNLHGEVEMFGDVAFTHWYVEADEVVWHFVTAGNPKNEPIVIVHGLPESWYAFHHQMRDLSDEFYCIGVDVIGNGQSDKRLDLDYSYAGIAGYLASFVDAIGLETFNLMGHDRGTVICDNLLNVAKMNTRVLRYIRMQQSANEPHGDPVPPHHIFASPVATVIAKWTQFPRVLYKDSIYAIKNIDEAILDRLDYEFKYKGIAEALPLPFRTTSFDMELEDRRVMFFSKMTMPVLFLQGRFDPGQHPEEYANTPNYVSNGRVQFIEAGHFFHLEKPKEATDAMRIFLSEPVSA